MLALEHAAEAAPTALLAALLAAKQLGLQQLLAAMYNRQELIARGMKLLLQLCLLQPISLESSQSKWATVSKQHSVSFAAIAMLSFVACKEDAELGRCRHVLVPHLPVFVKAMKLHHDVCQLVSAGALAAALAAYRVLAGRDALALQDTLPLVAALGWGDRVAIDAAFVLHNMAQIAAGWQQLYPHIAALSAAAEHEHNAQLSEGVAVVVLQLVSDDTDMAGRRASVPHIDRLLALMCTSPIAVTACSAGSTVLALLQMPDGSGAFVQQQQRIDALIEVLLQKNHPAAWPAGHAISILAQGVEGVRCMLLDYPQRLERVVQADLCQDGNDDVSSSGTAATVCVLSILHAVLLEAAWRKHVPRGCLQLLMQAVTQATPCYGCVCSSVIPC